MPLLGHGEAYTLANIFHRDISAGNILIDENGEGMLIDWDLALLYADVKKDLADRKPRMLWRTVRGHCYLFAVSPCLT